MGELQQTISTLMSVYRTNTPVATLPTEQYRSAKELYEVQEAFIHEKRKEQGGSVSGYKIGLTNIDLQKAMKADAPLYGMILNQDIVATKNISLKEFFSPRIEAELIFITKKDISLDADIDEIIEKTSIAPGIELPDSRLQNWFANISVSQLIIDNAVSGKVVIGEPRRIDKSFKLDDIGVTLFHNDEQIAKGQSSFVLNNPLNAVVWLQQKLASEGKVIKKGTIISSGTFIQPLPLEIGTYRAVFDHFGEVTVEIIA